jgi:signal transduction histidine kinase
MSWLADTLAKRLFWLMTVALVGSHFVAYLAVSTLNARGSERGVVQALERLPTMPSLPPMDVPPMGRPPSPGAEGRPGPPPGAPPDGPPRGLPGGALALDYGIRFALIALAAWFGARWLARPVARLVAASHQLGSALDRNATPPHLDEAHGTREVREAAQVFNHMASQLKQQFEARGLMIAAISHDLRTPLTRMRMRLETQRDEAQLRERCIADIREMDGLIDSVLDVFRGQHAGVPLQRTDVGALVQSLVDDMAELGQRVSAEGVPAVASVDAVALRRVLGNLIGNGLRYGTRVQVTVASDAQAVHILIDDDGPGIHASKLEAVFEPFVRVDTSRSRQTGGVGLGLFIARELTQRQGGTLTLSNRAQGGLRAEVRLPRVAS